MTSEERIAELEELVRQLNLEKIQGSLDQRSRYGNLYWDWPTRTEGITRPYAGNDRQFVSMFEDERYVKFVGDHPKLQEYWHSQMYLVKRDPDGYMQVCSNIHRGDFFGCGSHERVGQVYRKIEHIQCGLSPEYQKSSPQGLGGNYLSYSIGGNIGGHWCEPSHDYLTETMHFIWLPTVERLMFSGFAKEAGELSLVLCEIFA